MTHTMLSSGTQTLHIKGVEGRVTLAWEFWATQRNCALERPFIAATIDIQGGGVIHGHNVDWPDIPEEDIQHTATQLALGNRDMMRTLLGLVSGDMALTFQGHANDKESSS